eukprot:3602418-Rhodomonas_salina.1
MRLRTPAVLLSLCAYAHLAYAPTHTVCTAVPCYALHALSVRLTNDAAELYPDGAWWFMNGEVRRLPGLFWCNGQFTAVEEPFDEKRLRQE